MAARTQTPPATGTTVFSPRRSRGPVDAPGKRHRKPPPDEAADRHLGERKGKHMGQESVKNAPRSR